MRKLFPLKSLIPDNIVSSVQLFLTQLVFLMTYYLIRTASGKIVARDEFLLVAYTILLLGMLAGCRINYSMLLVPIARLQRLMGFAVLFYLLVDPSDLTVVQTSGAASAQTIVYAYWVAVVCAALSLFRPVALLFPAFHIYLVHLHSPAITGFAPDRLASVTLVESAQFLTLSILALGIFWQLSGSFFQRSSFVIRFRERFDELALGCLFIAISLHLSHYFWSGYEKLVIGEHFWAWITDNQTQNLILTSMYRGTLPSAEFPGVTQWLFDHMSSNVQWLNASSAVLQILAMVAVLHVFALRVLSLLYDALHIAIYLVSGLLLWPWVANNIAILYAIKSMDQRQLSGSIKLCSLVTIVLGGFQHFGNASRLAWWDLRDITGTFAQAKVADGQWRTLPFSYFNAHGRIITLESGQVQLPEHYSPTAWGASGEHDIARMNGECVSPFATGMEESNADKQRRENRIKSFLLAHHRKLLVREQLYANAHPYPSLRYLSSATSLPDGIERVDQITAYRFVMQSVCLNLEEGQIIGDVLREDNFVIDIDRE